MFSRRLLLLLPCSLGLLAGIASPVRAESPVQLSLITPVQIVSEEDSVRGLRLNLIYGRNESMKGLDVGLVNHTRGVGKGLQYGLVGLTDGDFTGWQDGFVVMTKGTMSGLQTGAFCSAGSGEVFQWGLVNFGDDISGLQLGFVNVANNLYGLQIGLINVIKSNDLPFLPIVNWKF